MRPPSSLTPLGWILPRSEDFDCRVVPVYASTAERSQPATAVRAVLMADQGCIWERARFVARSGRMAVFMSDLNL